mmetsp:Transcript_48367/g.82598  ORF Transcript_48367/g.82598 Transcript_48367/m.82598 type:complete len:225 (-) Transcript_48367:101-775(-)
MSSCFSKVMAFLRFQCDADDLAEFNTNVGLSSREVVLCPVTDTQDFSSTGSHWSLLVFVRTSRAFYHFDSCGRSNEKAARKTAEVLMASMASGNGASFVGDKDDSDRQCMRQGSKVPIVENMAAVMPRQTNGVDCGVYLLCVAEVVIRTIVDAAQQPERPDSTDTQTEDRTRGAEVASPRFEVSEVVVSAMASVSERLVMNITHDSVVLKRRELYLKVLELSTL